MGSSPEMERFGMSDADYEYMMNPLKRRPKQTKKQNMLGIFASDDSDSEVECTGFGGRASSKRKGANFSAPITFISGGVKLGTKPVEKGCEISDEDENILPGINSNYDSDSDSDSSQLSKWQHNNRNKKSNFKSGAVGRAVATAASQSNTSGFGAWERHTKGIGMKLLEQMGYEHGKGLGSEGQGITTPVQATQRVGKVAVGFYGSEKVIAPRRGNEARIVEPDIDSSEPRYKKKSKSCTQTAKPKCEYKTVDELVDNLCSDTPASAVKKHGIFLENSEMSKVKVIDMTSKEQKVYEGYEAAMSRVNRSGRKPGEGSTLSDEEGPDGEKKRKEKRLEGQLFDCQALRHNFSLILRSTEDEIRKLDRSARFEEDRIVGLEHEIEKITEVAEVESINVNRLQTALDLIQDFETNYMNSIEAIHLNTNSIVSWITRIKDECSDLPEMPILMACIARPMLDKSLSNWNPLKEPTFCLDLLSKWKDFFQNSSAFNVILETNWLSAVRRAVVNSWDPRDCDSLLNILEAWRPLLTDQFLHERILDQLVLPKLQTAISSWDPLTDTIPVHTWLHPWLPWFGNIERLSNIHSMVLHKLGGCLSNWYPSDTSAHSILLPWRTVLSVGLMSAFLSRHIIPKLEVTLQNFQLNPANQNMDPWKWVMRWADLIGPAVIVNMLEHHFWTRWLSVLSNWLVQGMEARHRNDQNTAAQIFQEVGRWYAGWKGQLPPECVEYASVKDALTRALNMMERAMKGLPPTEAHVPNRPAMQPTYSSSSGFTPVFNSTGPLVAPPITTLRKQVEQFAMQRGFLFHPIANRLHDGQQVYRLDSLHVFFDRNVSFVFNPTDGEWHPLSLSELMSRVR